MHKEALRSWRNNKGLTRKELAGMLGVTPMALAYWEWGSRRIPPLLPLALEALEHRIKEEDKHGPTVGMPEVQKAE